MIRCQSPGVESKKHIAKERLTVDFDLDQIVERGYLVALIDNSSTGFFLYKGQPMGYEFDLLNLFTDSLGIDLRIEVVTNLEQAFEMLDRGEGDIMAYNLTVTKERKRRIKFSHYHNLVRMVLIQKKPDDWRSMKLHEIENEMIRNLVDLIGEEVHVRYQSSYLDRLNNLSEEIGGDIIIIEEDPQLETEQLIRKVVEGEIKYTVAEEDIASINATYFPILDIETPISFQQQISWGVRKNADSLLFALNNWILEMRKTADYYVIYNKYFKSSKSRRDQALSEYSTVVGENISPFDDLIKKAASQINWDWRLLAAQIFQESKFDPRAQSWAGALGLMQVMPNTAKDAGVKYVFDPEENIKAGMSNLLWLQEYWMEKVEDPIERIKFILASYNVGQGHVMDAVRLAEKYEQGPWDWEKVSMYLVKKSESKYFNDPVVQFGYCRGDEPVNYVKEIISTYQFYKKFYFKVESETDSTIQVLEF